MFADREKPCIKGETEEKTVTEKQEKGVPRGKILRSTAVCHNKNMQSATSLVPIKNQYSDNPTVTAGRKRF